MDEYTATVGDYKGNAIITIFFGEQRILGFGVKKAAAIVACLDAIKKFVKDNELPEDS